MGLSLQPSRRISGKIATLIAVFALVVQPMYGLFAGHVANAMSSGPITTEAQLIAAAADPSVTVFSIKANIDVTTKINISGRDVYIDGNGNTLRFADDPDGWQGNYVLQAYKNKVDIKNLKITGGDAAIYANGAIVNLEGNVDVSDNEFGGIEVSQGSGVDTPAALNVGSANLANSTEANGLPTAWIDQSHISNASVNGSFTMATHIKPNQKQYYLSTANADIAATNTTTGETFNTIQAALDDTDTVSGHIIEVEDGIYNEKVVVRKSVTLRSLNQHGATIVGDTTIFAGGATIDGFVLHNNNTYGLLIENFSDPSDNPINIRNNEFKAGPDYGLSVTTQGIPAEQIINIEDNIFNTRDGLITHNTQNTKLNIHRNEINASRYVITVTAVSDAQNTKMNLNNINSGTVRNLNSLKPDLTKNWWGSASGPDVNSFVGEADSLPTVEPWLCQPFTEGTTTSVNDYCNQAPTVVINSPAENSIVRTNIGNVLNITGNFSDDIKANYLTLQLVHNGASKAIGTVYGYGSVFNPAATYADEHGNFTYGLVVPSDLADGQYSLWYVGTDFTGGVSTRTEQKFTIDNTRPHDVTININKTLNPTEIKVEAKDAHLNRIDVSLWKEGESGWIKFPGEWITPVGADFSKDYAGVGKLDIASLIADKRDGKYEVRATAVDAAKNSTNAVSKFFEIDTTTPAVYIESATQVNDNRIEFDGYAFDTNFEHYYCWLTGADGREIAGTRDDNCVTTWASDLQRNGNPATSQTTGSGTSEAPALLGGFDIGSLADGEYTVNIVGVDRAKNRSEAASHNITVQKSPILTAEAFTVFDSKLGVEFDIERFKDASRVEVAVYDTGHNLITTNVGDSLEMIDLLNTANGPVSSPFYIPSQPDDSYWTFGTADWANVIPSYAVVTVYYGNGEYIDDTVDFVESNEGNNGLTYAALIANLPPAGTTDPEEEANTDQPTDPEEQQQSTGPITDLGLLGGGGNFFQQFGNIVTDGLDGEADTENATDEDGLVAGASTDGDESEIGSVKAAQDEKQQWSMVNLLLSIVVIGLSVIGLFGLLGRSKENRSTVLRVLTVVPALAAGAVLLFVEDFSAPMGWVNVWSLLIGALVIVQLVLLANTQAKTE